MKFRTLVLVLLVLGAVAFMSRTSLLKAAGRHLDAETPPKEADVAVVLSGGFPFRPMEAAELYREGIVRRIIVDEERSPDGTDRLRHLGITLPTAAAVSVKVLMRLGVPASAIDVIANPSDSTRDEACFVSAYLRERRIRSVLLVTSRAHTRRALVIFRYLLPDQVTVHARGARDDGFDPAGWWRRRASVRDLVYEYQKLLAYRLMLISDEFWGSLGRGGSAQDRLCPRFQLRVQGGEEYLKAEGPGLLSSTSGHQPQR